MFFSFSFCTFLSLHYSSHRGISQIPTNHQRTMNSCFLRSTLHFVPICLIVRLLYVFTYLILFVFIWIVLHLQHVLNKKELYLLLILSTSIIIIVRCVVFKVHENTWWRVFKTKLYLCHVIKFSFCHSYTLCSLLYCPRFEIDDLFLYNIDLVQVNLGDQNITNYWI